MPRRGSNNACGTSPLILRVRPGVTTTLRQTTGRGKREGHAKEPTSRRHGGRRLGAPGGGSRRKDRGAVRGSAQGRSRDRGRQATWGATRRIARRREGAGVAAGPPAQAGRGA